MPPPRSNIKPPLIDVPGKFGTVSAAVGSLISSTSNLEIFPASSVAVLAVQKKSGTVITTLSILDEKSFSFVRIKDEI